MEVEDDPPMGIPEWVVTFGDMMSLLLTFFIMLVSMSEIKKEEKFQAMVESFRKQFGHNKTLDSLSPGDVRARPTANQVLATEGRARKKNTAKGGVPEKAPEGEEQHVRVIRPGQQTAIGSVIFFEIGSTVLTDAGKRALSIVANEVRGKSQRIEIRGHTSPEVAARTGDLRQSMDLSYTRSLIVMQYLVEQEKIEANRFRLSAASDHEPLDPTSKLGAQKSNPRVEVLLLDETFEDLKTTTRPANTRNTTTDLTVEETSDGQ